MNKITQPVAELHRIKDSEDVALRLERLDHDLPATRLAGVRNFNTTYLIITQNVRAAIRKGMFEHAGFINHFDGQFARYYLAALSDYQDGKPTPPAWHQAFDAALDGASAPLRYTGLGVNAHVNNDIAQVLRDCKASERHYGDYLLVNDIIADSVYQVLDSIDTPRRLKAPISPKRTILQPMYKQVMKFYVRRWRGRAWQNYLGLLDRRITIRDIEASAGRTARYLKTIPV
ncbi:MAG TPA: DUF5995 family protein [Candidatus Saccharimonadales bacterium]|jgi:hypothetical protein